jgi:hypothetical protein
MCKWESRGDLRYRPGEYSGLAMKCLLPRRAGSIVNLVAVFPYQPRRFVAEHWAGSLQGRQVHDASRIALPTV